MSEHGHTRKQRAQWTSGAGFILAAAGSAVGLGNIWKFPGKAFEGGGSSFIIMYILIVALIGSSVMLAELAVGRHAQKNPAAAFARHGKGRWKWVGVLGVITACVIISYYAQVGGWIIKYIAGYLTNSAGIFAEPEGYFYNVLGADGIPWEAAFIYPLIFLAMAAIVVIKGVNSGIERVSKVLMPGLFVLLIILTIRSVTLSGAWEGVRYLLQPDWSKLTPTAFMIALGQAFFSLSLGMGIMCTYGSYVNNKENIVKNTAWICTIDTLVAILAGFMIIPAVFAMGVAPGMGGGFAFISLAAVFAQMPLGFLFGAAFYLLLLFAALTSAISLLEVPVAYLVEEKGVSRGKAAAGLAVVFLLVGSLYTLSQISLPIKGIWFDGVDGLTFPAFGTFMEYLTDRLLIPLTAIAICIYVGWVWGPRDATKELTVNGERFALRGVWGVTVRFIAPAAILMILIGGLLFGMALS